MKTFFVKNLIVVFALLLGIGTMSFKMVEKSPKSPSQELWHWTKDTSDGQDSEYFEYEPAEGSYGCLSQSQVYCIIEAPEDPNYLGFPDLSSFTVISRKN